MPLPTTDCNELKRWKGHGLRASKGCKLRELCLDEATVLVEYESRPGEPATLEYPGSDAELNVVGVLINGCLISPDGVIDPAMIARWEEELREYEAEAVEAFDDARADRDRDRDEITEAHREFLGGLMRRAA